MDKKETDKGEKTLPSDITVHYIKMKNYRTYHVDGIFGGVSPSGYIYIEPFVQRPITPKTVTHGITEEGALGEEIPDTRTGKTGVVREIEAGLVMNVEVAKVLRGWLDKKIIQYDEITKETT